MVLAHGRRACKSPVHRVETLTPTPALLTSPLGSRAPSPTMVDMPLINCGADDDAVDGASPGEFAEADISATQFHLQCFAASMQPPFARNPLSSRTLTPTPSDVTLRKSHNHEGPSTPAADGVSSPITSLFEVSMPPPFAARALGHGGSAAVRGGSMSLHQSTMSLSASAEHSPLAFLRGGHSRVPSMSTAPRLTPPAGDVAGELSTVSDAPADIGDADGTPIIDLLPPAVTVPVAVKTIHEHDDARVEAGRRELAFARRFVRAAAAADAPGLSQHVVHVHHVSRNAAAQETTVVMEQLPGTTVAQLPALAAVRAARLNDATAEAAPPSLPPLADVDAELRRVAADALEGLRTLHEELRVVHRDVKPANLLLDHAGRVKVADFGVSAVLPAAADTTPTDAASREGWPTDQLGTFGYMAPERLRGEAHGPASDVWSLGVTLLELALGRHPFANGATGGGAGFWEAASAAGALTRCATTGAADAAASVRIALAACKLRSAGASTGFARLVTRCLEHDPAARPSAAALLQDAWFTPLA